MSINPQQGDKGVDEATVSFIRSMLNSQIITFISQQLSHHHSDQRMTTRISFISSSPAPSYDRLLQHLDLADFKTLGFADNLVVTVNGMFDTIISERSQQALNLIME